MRYLILHLSWLLLFGILAGCASTDIIESPRTAYLSPSAKAKPPALLWTSREAQRDYNYLGVIKVRSWSYEGAVDRLEKAVQEMRADAAIDIHFEPVGFLSSLQAFAIQFKQ